MVDDKRHRPDDDAVAATGNVANPRTPAAVVTADEVEAILNDRQMPIEERVERLRALARQTGFKRETDADVEFDPLSHQINEALNFLAGGGHSYGTAEAKVDPGDETSDPSPSDR